MANTIRKTTCNVFDISNRVQEAKKTKRTLHGKAEVEVVDLVSHAADALESKKDIDCLVTYLRQEEKWSMLALVVVGINTGFRIGDLLGFRVKDFDLKNKPSYVNIVEQKTKKARRVYLNKAVYQAIELVIKMKNLGSDDYLFTSDANKRSYLVEIRGDEVITSGEKFDEKGNERKIAPITGDGFARFLKKTTKKLNIPGHYSSHALRKTFGYHISTYDYQSTRNITAASMALNHSSESVTETFYVRGVDDKELAKVWLNLNLGIEALGGKRK